MLRTNASYLNMFHVYVSIFLLRIAAALESKKSRLMSITIPAYLPAVCKGCAFSDLVLVSSEGEHLSCHRCVLVARSGEGRLTCSMEGG